MRIKLVTLILFLLASPSLAQDRSPLRDHYVWLPMTGVTPEQMDDAVAAGYTAVMFKTHPTLAPDERTFLADPHAELIKHARQRGLKLILTILGWHGLDPNQFWDTQEDGSKLPGQLDPFWPEAMQTYEHYLAAVIDHYTKDPDVIAFAPTWGIYGEAGFTSFTAGRSPHALACFNEWLASQNLPKLERLPTKQAGPNTDFNRFIRFRYLFMQDQFDGIIRRLKDHAGGRPVGTWQEMYPAIGYLWTMVRVPSADFALYESCFPFQSNHDPQRTLAEAMSFRYRCSSADEFADYIMPLLARKRGEGQRFMGCQLTNDYAVRQYGWSEEKAKSVQFDRWEDQLGPKLQQLMKAPLESPERDVLLVFPTYAAAALTDHPRHSVDVMSLDVLLRQFGCQMMRIGSPRLDELTVEEMNAFRLIIVPASAYIMPETLARLNKTSAKVLFTGCFGQSFNGELVAFGRNRRINDWRIRYDLRPAGEVGVNASHPLTRGLGEVLGRAPVRLPESEGFVFEGPGKAATLLNCGPEPLLSVAREGRTIFLHGQFFADICFDANRKPPTNVMGSKDASANEIDMWGPYSSSHPQHEFATALMLNLLDNASVRYRLVVPQPRVCAPFLGDHLEAAGISANIAYNNTGEKRELQLRLPFVPAGLASEKTDNGYFTRLTVPAFSYVVLNR